MASQSVRSSSSAVLRPPRLRFAPSPTGSLHIGGLRTALYNHLLARKWGGKWVLRIEDTDQTRLVPGAVDELRRSLEWAGLDYDEGPGAGGSSASYVQSERLDLYHQHIKILLENGWAYRCFATPSELAELKLALRAQGSQNTYDRRGLYLPDEEVARRVKAGEKHVVRLKSRPDPLAFKDLVFGGEHAVSAAPMDDAVLLKADGFPTYHFANVVDDWDMGITHVLRGEEWLSSVHKHLQLYDAFGWQRPAFAHLPLLINADGTKLSKRDGAASVETYIEKGYEPAALNNFIALLGWGASQTPAASDGESDASTSSASSSSSSSSLDGGVHHHRNLKDNNVDLSGDVDFMTMSDMIDRFEIDAITRGRAQVQPAKLDFLQKLHLNHRWASSERAKDAMVGQLKQVTRERYPTSARAADEGLLRKMIEIDRVRVSFLHDIADSSFVFEEPDLETVEAHEMKKKWAKHYQHSIEVALARLAELPDADYEHVDALLAVLNDLGSPPGDKPLKRAQLWMPLRHALTGRRAGPAVAEIAHFIGRERTLARLEAALARHVSSLEGRDP